MARMGGTLFWRGVWLGSRGFGFGGLLRFSSGQPSIPPALGGGGRRVERGGLGLGGA